MREVNVIYSKHNEKSDFDHFQLTISIQYSQSFQFDRYPIVYNRNKQEIATLEEDSRL